MGIFRSENMCSGTLVLPMEKARHFVDVLGSSANLMFQDVHANQVAPQRPYKKFIQRIEDVEREVRWLIEKCKKAELPLYQNDLEGFLAAQSSEPYKLDKVEHEVRQAYHNVTRLDDNKQQLVSARNAAIEERHVLEAASMALFHQSSLASEGYGLGGGSSSSSSRPGIERRGLLDGDFAETQKLMRNSANGVDEETIGTPFVSASSSMQFNNAAGVINQSEQQRFARFIFRSTRGNAFTHFREIHEPLTDPKTGEDCQKAVFVVYYQGNSSSAMHARILRACQQFGANCYPWVTTAARGREKLRQISVEVNERERALMASEKLLKDELNFILQRQPGSYNSLLEDWRLFLIKEKGTYAVLDMCEGEGTTLRAQVWYPTAEEDFVRRVLIAESRSTHCSAMLITDRVTYSGGGGHGHDQQMPPTYFKSNGFLAPFQTMVNTYGIPRYQEMTPVFFSIVTFPFLFGVMFGDVGHGLMLLSIGIAITQHENKIKFQYPAVFDFRYMCIMMGFFAIYAGFIYNDFFATGMNLFGSRWRNTGKETDPIQYLVPDFDPSNRGDKLIQKEGGGRQYYAQNFGPYPFGVDPAWKGASNELNFMNSMKMKISVLLGVAHMILGLLLRLSNVIYERNRVDFICEFVPMMTFMICFFGYMDYMILYKWVTPMNEPPSIINTLISMVMQTENKTPLYAGAAETQAFLLSCMVFSVPCLLIPKPLILWAIAKRRTMQHSRGQTFMPLSETQHEPEQKVKFDMGETCIHQIIETIEFVLGTVSHTASYLRLWALSLAHQQLSVVFFKMLFTSSLTGDDFFLVRAVKIYISFFSFMVVSVAIFIGMDVMECFMHTLRLHWVEFQSKFFRADGYDFLPFRHLRLLTQATQAS
ncbi:unnamed protein product [Amoebophrya sp. A25]|nr:unnamed protein product [Amoebophrya sp. A25]|eukprot:GSA25T00021716001.1